MVRVAPFFDSQCIVAKGLQTRVGRLTDERFCRVPVMSSRVGGDEFLRVLQLSRVSHESERGDRGDGQRDLSTPSRRRGYRQ